MWISLLLLYFIPRVQLGLDNLFDNTLRIDVIVFSAALAEHIPWLGWGGRKSKRTVMLCTQRTQGPNRWELRHSSDAAANAQKSVRWAQHVAHSDFVGV